MDNSGKLLGAQINREWFLYQEKEVFAEYRQKRLTIGLPNEIERRENRVCLTPEAVAMMVDMGHTIMIQRGAGEAAHYHDREYADAGAQMLDTCEEVYTADIILKPTPVMQADVEMMHDRQVILSPIELFELRKEAVVEMMQKKVTAVGFDILKDENGVYPVVQMMSEISGSSAIMIASEYLSNSRRGDGNHSSRGGYLGSRDFGGICGSHGVGFGGRGESVRSFTGASTPDKSLSGTTGIYFCFS